MDWTSQQSCRHFVSQDQILRNPFIPVKVEASFNLNFTSIKDIISPILNASLPTSATAEVRLAYQNEFQSFIAIILKMSLYFRKEKKKEKNKKEKREKKKENKKGAWWSRC